MVVDEIAGPEDGRPGVARIRKEGKVIRGSISLRIQSSGEGSRVEWEQDIGIRGVPRVLDGAVAYVARRSYAAAIRRLLARG
jgi:hypothetical protein